MTPDLKSMFSREQAVTVTAPGTYILDLKDHGDDVNRELTLWVQMRAAGTAAGSATLAISLNTDGDLDAPGTDLASAVEIFAGPAIAVASLTAGASLLKIPLPPGIQRYLRINYTVATGPLLTGTIDAGLAWGIDQP